MCIRLVTINTPPPCCPYTNRTYLNSIKLSPPPPLNCPFTVHCLIHTVHCLIHTEEHGDKFPDI